MRSLLWIVVAACLVALTAAQTMPTCASNCLATFLPSSGCDATDINCICNNAALTANVQTCTLGNCTVVEALAAENATNTLCGVPVRDITNITPIITTVSGLLAIASYGLRVWDSFSIGFGMADLFATIALAFAIPMGVLEYIMSVRGFGKDIWTLTPWAITQVVKLTWLTEIFYFIAIGTTKLSLLFFYLRIFPARGFRHLVFVTMGFVAATTIAITCVTTFNCLPVPYIWTGWRGEGGGSCVDFNATVWAAAAVNIVLDTWILALPIPQLLKLQLSTKRKIQLVLMFCVGGFITVVSIVRLSALVHFATTSNATYDNVSTAYWSVLECYVSITCCCLPAVRSVLRRVLPSCFGGSTRDPSSAQQYAGNSIRISGKNLMMHSSSGIKKSVTHTVSYMPRSNNSSDVIELVGGGSGSSGGGPHGGTQSDW
ncbi:50S ribosomal protein L36e [Xylariaceae sp. FL0804]|nr:50S ribosomal protein L36e [Xylariaceae sp. FL0804]